MSFRKFSRAAQGISDYLERINSIEIPDNLEVPDEPGEGVDVDMRKKVNEMLGHLRQVREIPVPDPPGDLDNVDKMLTDMEAEVKRQGKLSVSGLNMDDGPSGVALSKPDEEEEE